MKSRDTSIGAGLLLLALVVLWHIRSFPPAPGQPYNSALFPGIAAVGLAIAAVILMIQGQLRRLSDRRDAEAMRAASEAAELENFRKDDVEILQTAEVPSRILAILLTAGAIVFYLLLSGWLGFIPTGILLLAALMWAYGVRPSLFIPISIIATLLIHLAFYKLLRVPLPWGILQPIAW